MMPDSGRAPRAVSFSCAKSTLDYTPLCEIVAGIRGGTNLASRLEAPRTRFMHALPFVYSRGKLIGGDALCKSRKPRLPRSS